MHKVLHMTTDQFFWLEKRKVTDAKSQKNVSSLFALYICIYVKGEKQIIQETLRMRPIVIWDVSDYDPTRLMLYHVFSKKSNTFETVKKLCGKGHAWTELPFAEVFPPNTSFYRADEACPRLEGLQKNLSGPSAKMGSGPRATD